MKFFISPMDVLLFRDGRPYNAGEDHVASSFFPPQLSVIKGMIRSTYLMRQGMDLEKYRKGELDEVNKVIGSPSESDLPFNVVGPLVGRLSGESCELLFPWPANLIQSCDSVDGKEVVRVISLIPGEPPSGSMSSIPNGLRPLLPADQQFLYSNEIAYLTKHGLTDYLMGKVPAVDDGFTESDVERKDYRVGLALSNGRKMSADGMLYTTHYTAVNPGFGLAIELLDACEDLLAHDETVKLGGDGRVGVTRISSWEWPEAPDGLVEQIVRTGKFSIYLATPALFCRENSGSTWCPDDWSKLGVPRSARLVGFAPAGPPIEVGGWDLARNRAKPLRWGVPQGSVYFFDINGVGSATRGHDVRGLFEGRWLKALQKDGESSGMGVTLIGGW